MNNETSHHLERPLYRFFNLITFLLYLIATAIVVGCAFWGWSTRPISSAKVFCNDGTSWDATKFYNNEDALCGVCTQRSQDNKKYTNCGFSDPNMYTSYKSVDKQYDWSWNVILYPTIAFVISFGIVDFLKIALIYIFSGKIEWGKSIVLSTLKSMFSSQDPY